MIEQTKPRILVWFSCGAASAVAAKETLRLYSTTHNVVIVNCDTRPSEHDDNYRFSREVEAWLGQPMTYIRNDKYATVDDVFEQTRYMSGINGARCTTELKKLPRLRFQHPDDTHVFGFTYEEQKRIVDFEAKNPELRLLWPLRDQHIRKSQCFYRLAQADITLPQMYVLGFESNNCPGCVKATSPWYWDMTRTHFPATFARRARQSRDIGCRLVRVKGRRIFLDELPPGSYKKPKRKEKLSCGPECGQVATKQLQAAQ